MNLEVSVIIPAYNSAKYIGKAIESVLNQTYYNLEIIIVDDASTDATLKIIKSFRDKRLKIIKNKRNLGVSAARNLALKQSRGNWIALLDSDDWYASERLEKLLQIAWKKNADMVADNLYLIGDGEQHSWNTLLEANREELASVESVDAVRFIKTDRPSSVNSPRTWSLGYTKPLMKRSFLRQNNLKYNENLKVGEDFALYLQCLIHQARFFLVPQAYYYYRIRKTSLSVRKPTEYLYQSHKITQDFIKQEQAIQNNRELLTAMSENLREFKKRLSYYNVIEFTKQGNIDRAIGEVINNPSILLDFFNKISNTVWQKTLDRVFLKKFKFWRCISD
jgi:succinoglycan biosynthesis protein ExoO